MINATMTAVKRSGTVSPESAVISVPPPPMEEALADKAGHIKNSDELKHERRAADDPYKHTDKPFERSKPAHRAEADDKAERKRKNKRQREDL